MGVNKKIQESNVSPLQVFHKSLNDKYIELYRTRRITMPEIRREAYAKLKYIYNLLYSNILAVYKSMDMLFIPGETIVERMVVELILAEIVKVDINAYSCFNYLKQHGVIGVCGAGYIFEEDVL